MLWTGSVRRIGVDLGATVGLGAIFREFGNFRIVKKQLLDIALGLKEVHYRECIGRDIGHGSWEEDRMLWSGFGDRLGVDLARGSIRVGAEERQEISRISMIAA